jgi:hypothetical protein
MTERFEARNPDFDRIVRDSFARQGLMSTLGARIVALEPGLCVIEMHYASGISQQNGYFHGGAVGAIADSAAGYADGKRYSDRRIQAQSDPPGRAANPARRGPGGARRQNAERVPGRRLLRHGWQYGSLRPAAVDADAACNLYGQLTLRSGRKKEKPLQSHQHRPE